MKRGHWLNTLALIAFAVGASAVWGCNSKADDLNRQEPDHASDGKINQTDADGNTVSADPNDWRLLSNTYGNDVVIRPVYPNPTRDGIVHFQLYLRQPDQVVLNGLFVQGFRGEERVTLFSDARVQDSPLRVEALDMKYLAAGNSLANLRGKQVRLFFYDNRGILLTYGDVEISTGN